MKESKKKAQKIVEVFKKTTTVGLVVTLIFSAVIFSYYSEKADLSINDKDHSFLYQVLELIDQKSLDFRLRFRGQYLPKEKVGILAIDDASLNQIGRWPWSREKIAVMVDNLMKQGAKVLGFDIVFAEPQVEKAREIIDTLEKEQRLTPPVAQVLNHIKAQLSPDSVFAEVVRKHREKLVMGAFFDYLPEVFEPYQNLCYTEAFKQSQGYFIREIEEWPPFIFNDYYTKGKNTFIFENTPFDKFFQPLFDQVAKEETEKFIKERLGKSIDQPLTMSERVQVSAVKEKSLRQYCSTWLNQKQDRFFDYWEKNWAKLFADHPLLSKSRLRDEIDKLRGYIFINPIIQTGRWTVDVPEIARSAAHFGMFNAFPDGDGVIRRSPLFYRAGARQEDLIPSLALQTYLISTGYQAYLTLDQDLSDPLKRYENQQFAVSKLEIRDPEKDETKFQIPVDHRGRLLINYAGPQMAFPHLPASELFHDRPQIKIYETTYDEKSKRYLSLEKLVDRQDFIKDRLFLVGATATAVYDLRVTPFEEGYPGVETHANILANLMSQNFLRSHPQESLWMILAVIVLGIGTSLLIHYQGPVAGLITTTILVGGVLVIDRHFLFGRGILAATIFLVIEIGLIYVSMTFFKYFIEERKKKYLKATFAKYVSPAIVEEILKDPNNVELGGRKQRMSVFFSDIRGFTTISEKLDPQVLSSVLNEYLTPMTNIVFNNKGTLDKYMGDAIMAFFGAPISYDDHAKCACRSALQSLEKLKDIQENFKQRGLPNIDIGIGINTYDMSVGNMGSDIVRSYTVMGDGVNLGSRLEGINKEYGTRIVISEFTHGDIKEDFTCRELDWVRVKGKFQPIKIYELICEGAPSAEKAELLKHYNRGYQLYRESKFKEAIESFEEGLKVDPSDPVSLLYTERCLEYLEEPPPADWDGVFVMKTK